MTLGSDSMAFVTGLFMGTLVGAATAVLTAPASGRELRTTLRTQAKRLAVKASELVPETWSELAEEELTKKIVDNISNLRAAGL